MKEEKDLFDRFKEKDRTLGEKPSANAWNKLEAKLDNHALEKETPVVPLKPKFKWLQLAAGLLVLIGAITFVKPKLDKTLNQSAFASNESEPFLIEDLEYAKPSGFYALAIQSSKYYNTSPSKLAEGSHQQRLEITDRKTRTAKQPVLAMKEEAVANGASSKVSSTLMDSISFVSQLDNRDVIVLGTTEDDHLTELMEIDKDELPVRATEQIAGSTHAKKKTAAASKSYANAKEIVHGDDELADTYSEAEVSVLDVTSNAISFDSPDVSNVDVDYFNWLIGNWKAPFTSDKTNIQNWVQKDNTTLSGKATLKINGKEILVENMEIKKIENELYFIRVSTTAGETIKYKLVSLKSGEAVFSNATLNDQFRLRQNTNDNFSQENLPAGALQQQQFPGATNSNINFSRGQKK